MKIAQRICWRMLAKAVPGLVRERAIYNSLQRE
jgi:hypothetical protein